MIKILYALIFLLTFFFASTSIADEWIVKFRMADMESTAAGEDVESFVRDLYGVDEVDLNLPDQSVTVTFESSDIDLDTLEETIAAANFAITKTIPVKEG